MIENYACRDIAEALSLVPGIYITDDYSLAQIGVRGIAQFGDWNSRVMLLLDGHPTSEQYGGTHSIIMPGVDIENIDRIEVIKGPSSSLYRSNAFFGIVNLITKKPNQNTINMNSSYFVDTRSNKIGTDIFYRFSKNLSIQLTGTWLNRNGSDLFFREFSNPIDSSLWSLGPDGYNQYYLDPESFNGGIAQKMNTMELYMTYGRINWRKYYLNFRYNQSNNGIPHGYYGALFNRPENHYQERRHFIDLGYYGDLSNRVNLSAQLSWDYYSWGDYILYNYSSSESPPGHPPGPTWQDWEYSQSFGADARMTIDINNNNTAVVGTEVKFHRSEHKSGETDASGEDILENVIPADNVRDNGQIYNLYAQDEFTISPKIKFVGGLHFNYYTYTTGKVMPKTALIYRPYKQGTYKLIISRGYRSPTFYELAFDDSYCFIGNPDLEPELITSYEIISTHSFLYGFSFEIAGNHSRMTDLILQTVIDQSDPAHPGGDYMEEVSQFRNRGRMISNSIEFSIRRNPVYGFSGFANVTFQDVSLKDTEDSNDIYNSPHWLGNIGLTKLFFEGCILVGAKINYIGSRRLGDGSYLEENMTTDININWKGIAGMFDASFGIKNLFDKEYYVPLNYDYAPSTKIQRPGRSINAKLQTSVDW